LARPAASRSARNIKKPSRIITNHHEPSRTIIFFLPASFPVGEYGDFHLKMLNKAE
jgi:hypothetical protein